MTDKRNRCLSRPKKAVLCLVLGLIFASCTGVEPVINEAKWRIIYRDDNDSRFEEMHINLRLSDGDGFEDLAQIIVSSKKEDLEWKISSNQWTTGSLETGKWTTLPPLLAPDGGTFSNEVFTLTVEDLAGESDQTTFRPNSSRPRLEDLSWPTARMEDGVLELNDNPGPASIILRDVAGESIRVMDAFNGMYVYMDNISTWEIWIPLPDISSAYRLGPYSVFVRF